jgi:hypothetical protein
VSGFKSIALRKTAQLVNFMSINSSDCRISFHLDRIPFNLSKNESNFNTPLQKTVRAAQNIRDIQNRLRGQCPINFEPAYQTLDTTIATLPGGRSRGV